MRVLILGLMGIAIIAMVIAGCSSNKEETLTNDEQHIKNVVSLRSPQLKQIYEKHYNYKPQSGTLKIKLFITELGTVQNSELTIDQGSFTPEFLADIKNKLSTWEFIIKKSHIYSYKMTFNK